MTSRDPAPGTTPATDTTRGGRVLGRLGLGLAGVLATLVGMAAGHLVASLLIPASSPVLAVGSAVIDATPTPMKEWAIRNFGSNDKVILIGSVMVVVLLVSSLAGFLARRRLAYGAGFLVLLVAVAATAALTRPTAGLEDAVPSLVAAIAGVLALGVLIRAGQGLPVLPRRSPAPKPAVSPEVARGLRAPDEPAPQPAGASRRGVLIAGGVLAVLAGAMGGVGRFINSYRSRPEDIALPTPSSPAPPLPTGLESKIKGITPLRIANADFYRVDTRLDTPVLSAGDWTLTIDGDVRNQLELTFDDLLGMELIERDITMTCVSNSVGGPYVGAARWLGVRLTDLLDMAGVGDQADQILSTDFDGMKISTPLDLATDGRDAMIAIGMNGTALPREHGFPARMIVPGLYGFISGTKWVTKLTLTTYAAETAYWTDRKWATDAPIKISTRIDLPRALQMLQPGKQTVGGVAWAQQRGGIEKVQVRIDGGAWEDATMGPDVNSDYWRQWYYEWDATSGQHSVSARAISGNGEEQSAVQMLPFPEGSSGIQNILVNVS
ncbi:molybdopterin-dependent oxidoreductase [Nocardioides sp. TRM66260-LWL]|uniref:molybdopterin-dependent oxidoreductase n=1 Tax=Nocardioides sp. TRM66260-LWL TaxID=2874478 RepID=UPI001CC76456|nr:molybdopterin-dependent oxidoreductase [Nocardioides sp. TRM66260-LWL]MBZ5735997.1 molybdopterin-dependent oxidoreductase [Nocardioides sp. TRM66260-LWL]